LSLVGSEQLYVFTVGAVFWEWWEKKKTRRPIEERRVQDLEDLLDSKNSGTRDGRSERLCMPCIKESSTEPKSALWKAVPGPLLNRGAADSEPTWLSYLSRNLLTGISFVPVGKVDNAFGNGF
jgi:hypothetical protein